MGVRWDLKKLEKKKKKMVGSEVRFKKAWKKKEEENGWDWGEILKSLKKKEEENGWEWGEI